MGNYFLNIYKHRTIWFWRSYLPTDMVSTSLHQPLVAPAVSTSIAQIKPYAAPWLIFIPSKGMSRSPCWMIGKKGNFPSPREAQVGNLSFPLRSSGRGNYYPLTSASPPLSSPLAIFFYEAVLIDFFVQLCHRFVLGILHIPRNNF